MVVGFTGTRDGMTEEQKLVLRQILKELQPLAFHHGDCIGADAEAAHIARAMGVRIVRHPPIETRLRAYAPYDEDRPPKTYLARNRDIVNESDIVIGASFGPTPHPTGGTWYTINYGEKKGKRVIVIWPNGTTENRGHET